MTVAFWIMPPCNLVGVYQSFVRTCRLHLQSTKLNTSCNIYFRVINFSRINIFLTRLMSKKETNIVCVTCIKLEGAFKNIMLNTHRHFLIFNNTC
jgi:hypothetical protein